MPKIPATTPPWFKLELYSRVDVLDFSAWKTQVENRVHLAALLSSPEQHSEFDKQFAQIAKDPLTNLGFKASYSALSSVYPQTIIKSAMMFEALNGHIEQSEVDRKTQFDETLAKIGDISFAMHRHITVDLHASETKIKRDFAKYIEMEIKKNRTQFKRTREAEITLRSLQSWNKRRVLPYQDLWLWHQRHGQAMSDFDASEWIFPDGSGDKDTVAECRKKAKIVFTLTTIRQLSMAAA